MHNKSDSDLTSGGSSPRRPPYYEQSPFNHDTEKMSYGSSPFPSPHDYQYHCSPIHHSRESSTSRFSAPLKTTTKNAAAWKRLQRRDKDGEEAEGKGEGEINEELAGEKDANKRFYNTVRVVLAFIVLFTLFALAVWAASTAYPPQVYVKRLVFDSISVQSGEDKTGVPTDMLNLKATIKIFHKNRATFFGMRVKTALQLDYFQRHLATGFVNKFYQHRKSERIVEGTIEAHQVPLYGAVPVFKGGRIPSISVPLNVTINMRSKANVLGKLVRTKFYSNIRCEVILRGKRLGKPVNLKNSCVHYN